MKEKGSKLQRSVPTILGSAFKMRRVSLVKVVDRLLALGFREP